jgi:hypothetical protein
MILKLSKAVYGAFAALAIFWVATSVGALTIDKIHVSQGAEGAEGSYRVTTMDEEAMKSEGFLLNSQRGNFSSIHMVREKGKWDKDFLLTSRFYNFKDQVVKNSVAELKLFMKTLDNVLPNEEIIVICYWLDFKEITIYFAPERWADEKFHKDVVRKLKS